MKGFSAFALLIFGVRSFFVVGASCALQGMEQHPWPILTRCQKHLPLPSDKQKCFQKLSMSPGGKIAPGWGPLIALKNLPEASLCQSEKSAHSWVSRLFNNLIPYITPSLTLPLTPNYGSAQVPRVLHSSSVSPLFCLKSPFLSSPTTERRFE